MSQPVLTLTLTPSQRVVFEEIVNGHTNVWLWGPPATGKTVVLTQVEQSLDCRFYKNTPYSAAVGNFYKNTGNFYHENGSMSGTVIWFEPSDTSKIRALVENCNVRLVVQAQEPPPPSLRAWFTELTLNEVLHP